jgi:hypothetical protein
MEGVISTLNSTTTLLLASTSFVGTFENCQNFTELLVSIYQKEFAFNVRVNWSNDGVTVWTSEVIGALPARGTASMSHYRLPIRAAYYRISYSNGTGNQTAFSLQTLMQYWGNHGPLTLPSLYKLEYQGEWYPLKIAYINAATGAATYTIITGVANKIFRVLDINLTIAIAGTVAWASGAGATVQVQPMTFAASGQFNRRGRVGEFCHSASPGDDLKLITTGASQIVRGSITYFESNS